MPTTQFTTGDGLSIAYQRRRRADLVYVPGWISNVELKWTIQCWL